VDPELEARFLSISSLPSKLEMLDIFKQLYSFRVEKGFELQIDSDWSDLTTLS